ncbi:MAG: HelD family protein [Acidimicrobiales bacterium]
MTHPDVPAEQAHLDLAYERLAAMRATAGRMLQDAFGERGGTFQALTERDIRVRTSLERLEHLEIGRESLVFGRIDRNAEVGSDSYHIGRLAVSGPDQEPVVVDWRAPIAEPFYRATGAHPMGLSRRRHLLTEGRRVLDLEDELFDVDGGTSGVGLDLSGPQALLATLERSRTGRMRDIVATVQREQDEVIRSPLPGILVVQGGPGTGKTAVALHRAAYLLYTHRFPLEGQGVLVVGPNPTFLRYIEHVLPSLDENGVELSTVNGLYPGTGGGGSEDEEIAQLKGDPRMAKVIAHAVADRERPLRHTVEVPYGPKVLRITPRISGQVVAAAKRRAGTHNARRRTVEALLWRQLLPQASPDRPGSSDADDGDDRLDALELGRALRGLAAVARALDRMWPLLTPEELLHDLFGAVPLIELAAGGILSSHERRRLWRLRGESGAEVAWSDADVALLDEALALLGPRRVRRLGEVPGRNRYVADGTWAAPTFGHVVMDEAQDLSPMQLRMVARRSLSGSMTVVGDIAQATGSWVPTSWAKVVEHLPARRGWRASELTVNYRTPSEIMDVAARVLEQVAPSMRPPQSVRSTGSAPRVLKASLEDGPFPGAALGSLAARAVQDEIRSWSSDLGKDGTVGVIVAPSLVEPVAGAIEAAGVPVGRAGSGALDEQVTLLTIDDAKGLEFDSVVVVEPERVAQEIPQGLRALYVAFTRATRRLAIVHTGAMPSHVASAVQSSA